jgi:hypothetical protein
MSVTEWRLSLRDTNQERVEQTVGWPLYTYIRALEAVAAYRRGAITRAYADFSEALGADQAETEISARGLLVLQRAALAVEDLGGLLHALRSPDPFLALTSTKIDDIDGVFVDVIEERAEARTLFRLPTQELIEREEGLDEPTRSAYLNLLEITTLMVTRDLALVGSFWMAHRAAAKRTLHGFGLVASAHVLGPPPAGDLAKFVSTDQERPLALSLMTKRDDQKLQVNTEYQVIELTEPNVTLIERSGSTALDLVELVRDGWLFGLKTGGFALPTKYADRLEPDERAALEEDDGDRPSP